MKQLITLVVLCCLHNCTSQTKKNSVKENIVKNDTIIKSQSRIKKDTLKINSMERFDIKEYDAFKIDDKYSNNPLSDMNYKLKDERIRITYHKEKIQVDKTFINNPFSISKVFFKTTKSLQYAGKEFYSNPIGTSKEFDKNGKLIKEINHDLPYKFSIEDLEQKMKKEYDIDIMNVNEIFMVSRGKGVEQDENLAHYIITIETRAHEFQEYLVDGISGKTLFISEPSSDEDEEGIIEKYFSKETRQGNLHTRHNGKDYTRKEWEAYQKTEEYKKDNPSVWDSLFGKKNKE